MSLETDSKTAGEGPAACHCGGRCVKCTCQNIDAPRPKSQESINDAIARFYARERMRQRQMPKIINRPLRRNVPRGRR